MTNSSGLTPLMLARQQGEAVVKVFCNLGLSKASSLSQGKSEGAKRVEGRSRPLAKGSLALVAKQGQTVKRVGAFAHMTGGGGIGGKSFEHALASVGGAADAMGALAAMDAFPASS